MVGLKDMFGGGGAPGSFLGLPRAEPGAPGADIVIFGADCATPYKSVGPYCAEGPAAMRAGSAAYAGDTAKVNFDLGGPVLLAGVRAIDAGDLSVEPSDPAHNRALIEATTRAVLSTGAVPVLLGGDDSLPIPLLAAYADHSPITILQIDAHIDWRDEVEGERWGLSSTMRRASEMPHVERIIQVGARGVGSARMDALKAAQAWGAHLIPAHELDTDGIERALALIPEDAQVVICFDCDALDPSIMPAVIAPTAGGLTYAQALRLIRGVSKRARIAGFDLVEFMPSNDRDGVGAVLAAQLLTTVLGLIGRQVAASG
ncbi:arginase family protein [Ruegeria sp. WL0004]|uniref:Arginase family protein n=1 Tax=Ruegeria marisflavi TaxID=2984152 RepID=A0ABT2WQ99_9RHOB|nr:arginase family protein [Ruegeria sp. WL0004]MCU9838084.1 arginase family protein [Ruegeria sp. WL0004]